MSQTHMPGGAPARQRIAMPVSMYGSGGILRADARGELHQPQFDNTYSVFRILPAPHINAPGQLEPWRVDRQSYGQWFLPLYVAKSIGMDNDTETWVVHDPFSSQPFNPRSNPVAKFRRALDNAKKSRTDRQGWASLLEGGAGRGAPIPHVDCRPLIRVYLPHHKSKPQVPAIGKPETGQLAYFLLSSKTWESMCKIMEEPAEGVRTDSSNPNAGFKLPDPIHPDQGVYWVVYKDGNDPRNQNAATFQQPGGYGQIQQPAAATPKGFGIHTEALWLGQSAAIPPHEMQQLMNMMPHWDNCVSVLGERDQVARLIKLFRQFVGAVWFALGDEYSDLFSDAERMTALQQLGQTPMVPVGVPGGFIPPAPYGVPQPAYGPPAQPYSPIGYGAPAGLPAITYPSSPGGYAPIAGAADSYPQASHAEPQAAPQYAPGPYAAPGAAPGYGGGQPAQTQPAYTPPFQGDPFVGQQMGHVGQATVAAAAQAPMTAPPAGGYPTQPSPSAYPPAAGGPPQPAPGQPVMPGAPDGAQAVNALANAQAEMARRNAAALAATQQQSGQRPQG